jgi:hypothetical protein
MVVVGGGVEEGQGGGSLGLGVGCGGIVRKKEWGIDQFYRDDVGYRS